MFTRTDPTTVSPGAAWSGACLALAFASALAQTPAYAGEIDLADQNIAVHVASIKERRDARLVKQEYDFSCGSAALATLLTYSYDKPINEQTVFKAMYATGDQDHIRKVGFSLLDMQKYLASRNLHAEGYKISLDKLQRLQIPAIALISPNGYHHFVVVRGGDGRGLIIADPRLGLRRMSLSDFQDVWNGVIFVIRDGSATAQAHFNDAADLTLLPAPPYGEGMIYERQDLTSFFLTLPGLNDY